MHTVGLLLEDNYKEVLHSQSFDDLTKNIQSAIRGQNPLDTGKAPKSGQTYERINRDTGKKKRPLCSFLVLNTTIEKKNRKCFAESLNPILNYISFF